MLNNKIFFLIMLLIGFVLCSCEKSQLKTSKATELTNADAQIKVIYASTYRANPRYQITLNGDRISNILSFTGTSPNPTPFPGGGLNTGGGSTSDYLGIAAIQSTFKIIVPKSGTNIDSVEIASSQNAFDGGKKYSLYFTDTAANATSILVLDSLTRPDSGFVKYKFVNLMPNLPALDLCIGSTKVASNIAYKTVSPTFLLPTSTASTSTTWAIREVGGTTNITTYASASTLSNQRVFSIIARGYSTITTAADIRRAAISLVYNE